MIHVALPIGSTFGWGVAGKAIARELAMLTPVQLLTDPFTPESVGDVLEFLTLSTLVPAGLNPAAGFNPKMMVAGPVLQAMTGVTGDAYRPGVRGSFNVGYTFFEDNLAVRKHIETCRRNFDVIAAGADWCRDALIEAGYKNAVTIIQGVDPRLFNPSMSDKEYFPSQFIIYSGGKLEFRKGQDIVIRAFKVMADKYPDVGLVVQWYNQWPATMQSMAASKLIRYEQRTNDYFQFINQLMADNVVDPGRVLSLGPMSNMTVARIYKNTDVGLFPNRCEGGTNLVMNEYMACGKPVIAAYSTGQRDVLTDTNSRPIKTTYPFTVTRDGEPIATWEEPDLDETIAHLEWAYHHREELKQLGTQAGEDQKKLTWRHVAEQFLAVLEQRTVI